METQEQNTPEKHLRETRQEELKTGSSAEIEKLVQELEAHRIELQIQNEELRRTQAELEASRDRYADLYDFGPVGYFTLDDKGIILEVNLTGAGQLGVEQKLLYGKPFLLYVDDESRNAFYAHLRSIFHTKGRNRCELNATRIVEEGTSKKRIHFYAELESLYKETPQGEGRCRTTLNDRTDRKAAEDALRKMNEALLQKDRQVEETTRARNRFFSFISHEMKTPLNSIVGFAKLLTNERHGPLTPEQKRMLARVNASAGQMVQLINNLFDAARIDLDKTTVQCAETALPELLERIVLPFEPLLKEKRLDFQFKMSPACPTRFFTDPEKIRSIVTNLLSNAIRFTKNGCVRLTLEYLPTEHGIRLAISDTGIGIAPERLSAVFEEYEQSGFVRENPIRYTSGSGLGLWIVKKMVSSLGGSIQVESEIGKGSTFTVLLPEGLPPNPQG